MGGMATYLACRFCCKQILREFILGIMFHLAIPVRDLAEARQFYVAQLNCQVGRIRDHWLDLYFFGHQLTLHEKPGEVLSIDEQGVRHFGAILDWSSWEAVGTDLQEKQTPLVFGPEIKYQGEPREQGKIFLRDPSGNGIELKAYRHPKIALDFPKTIKYL